jgi:hypothetical protein
MTEDRNDDERRAWTGLARRSRAALYGGLVSGAVGMAVAGNRLRRVLDRRTTSRQFAGTPCSQLARPEEDPAREGADSER